MKIGPFKFGGTEVELVPHYIPGEIGQRVFMIIDPAGAHSAHNITAADARLLADQLKLAIDAAEAMERRAKRKLAPVVSINQT